MYVRRRFRFSDEERLKALQELYEIMCNGNPCSEEELWKKVHANLCKADKKRYSTCTLRGLKDHMLLQVSKFAECNSEEASDYEKAKLKSLWGTLMRNLMEVWANYEELIKSDAVSRRIGKRRKDQQQILDLEKRTEAATILATNFADSSLALDDHNEGVLQPCAAFLAEVSQHESAHSADESDESPKTKFLKTSTTETEIKKKNHNNVYSYLMEKCRLEMEARDKDRQLRYEELALQRARLKFEEKKWKASLENNKANAQLSQATSVLLTTILRSGILNKIEEDKSS